MLLVVCGGGAAFAIRLLDEVVGECVKDIRGYQGEKFQTNWVDFVWCIRSLSAFFKKISLPSVLKY